jgi:queuine tRNA-ribosyltransferase
MEKHGRGSSLIPKVHGMIPRVQYELQARDGSARRGLLRSRRGLIDTPAFMPVGTAGTVKAMLPHEVAGLGAQIILGNTYHLSLRPGIDVIAGMGGLHKFMAWPGPILTDSGGFQVFSLAGRRKLGEEGVSFRSHLDGGEIFLTPEGAVQAQEYLGSDIMMMLDECPPPQVGHDYAKSALLRDYRWAERALRARGENSGALFAIIQGGMYKDLRAMSAALLTALPFDGYALGGLSVGEPKEATWEMLTHTIPLLPRDKPVYLMGVGEPEDLVTYSGLGVDMFDCVLPTRMARNGTLLTAMGRLNIRNRRFRDDPGPVEEQCGCYTCRTFSRAYLRHLFMARELLAYRLNTIHNLYYILKLMESIRQAVETGVYPEFSRRILYNLKAKDNE